LAEEDDEAVPWSLLFFFLFLVASLELIESDPELTSLPALDDFSSELLPTSLEEAEAAYPPSDPEQTSSSRLRATEDRE